MKLRGLDELADNVFYLEIDVDVVGGDEHLDELLDEHGIAALGGS